MKQRVTAPNEALPSSAAAAGRVVLGALAGAAGGLVAGLAGFESLVAAFLGGLAGAVGGILAAARSLERA
jgi:hypothetical protein